jgi:TetR/AcrR family transcriptional regulator, cholesterol catabolism regulator
MPNIPMGPPSVELLRSGQRARRDRIVHAALRKLAADDYDKVKISEVAVDAEVAIGTLYRYFSSKEHLFAAVFKEWQDSLGRQIHLSALRGDTNADRLLDLLMRMIRAFQAQPQFYKLLLVLQTTTDPYAAEIYDYLDSGFRSLVETALDEVTEKDRLAISRVIGGVLDQNMRGWVMNRLTITQARENITDAVRLIFEFGSNSALAPVMATSAGD